MTSIVHYPRLIKSADEARREKQLKVNHLVFPGLSQSCWIPEEELRPTDALFNPEPVMHSWDRYWNGGYKVKYRGRHICTSYYYPTHILCKNGRIIEIGTRASAWFGGNYTNLLTDFEYFYQGRFSAHKMPEYADWLMDNPMPDIFAVENVIYFLRMQEQERKNHGLPSDTNLDAIRFLVPKDEEAE